MQINLLKEIVTSIAGPQATGIVNLLYGKKNVNEFLIAKKLGLTINQTRNILYKLADDGLVSFIRKKDNKKGGWYTYFWTINTGKSLTNLKNTVLKKIDEIKGQINEKKTRRFYYSANCGLEYTEENALINDFVCQECGDVLQLKDNSPIIAGLEKEMAKLENNLALTETELVEINKQDVKVRIRKLKAEAKKKQIERIKKKKAKERELKKLGKKKKIGKKKTDKKKKAKKKR